MISLIHLALISIMISFLYCWPRRHLYAAASKFRGPFALPIIGNGLYFMCKTEDIFNKLIYVLEKYGAGKDPLRIWMGPHLVICLKDPVHLEKIMSSPKFATISKLVDIVKYYWGEGLITASGPRYKKHRRAIQPIFDLNFAESALSHCHKHTSICIEKLQSAVDGDTFNIWEYISKFSMDLTGEIIAGQDIGCQVSGKTSFCYSMEEMYEVCVSRISKIWQHPDKIYNLLPAKKRQDKIIADFSDFTQKAIVDSRLRENSENMQDDKKFIPAIDNLTKIDGENPNLFTNQDLKDHLITLIAATDDPLGLIASFSAVCFGMYPEYQERALKEIWEIIGKQPREITLQDLRGLEYLDMCVKDVMRLFPIAPILLRETPEDYKLDKWLIPKEASIMIPIYAFHMDREYWVNPQHFHPDHFSREAVKNRHIYAYLPFSAGPRGCIGKILANVSIKIFLVHLLQNFEIHADGKVPDIQLMNDISIRPKNGFNIRLKKRVCS